MAKGLFDGGEVEVPCPNCGTKHKGTLGSFRAKGHFVCAGCGKDVHVDLQKFDEGTRSVQESLKKLGFKP